MKAAGVLPHMVMLFGQMNEPPGFAQFPRWLAAAPDDDISGMTSITATCCY